MSHPHSKIVLIVDDNHDAADTLAVLVRRDGHTVLVAYDSQTGFDLAHTSRPDIVFHDVGLPIMNGYDAVRRLRAEAKFAKTLLVAVTAYNSTHDRKSAAIAGFDIHMSKPVDFERIKEILRLPKKS